MQVHADVLASDSSGLAHRERIRDRSMIEDGIRMTSIRQVAQRAEDLDRSVAFYRDVLGAGLIGRFDPPGLAFFSFGDVRVMLGASAPSATLYFAVEDIETSYVALASQGIVFESEPQLVHRDDEGLFGPPGEEEWMAFFRDPDGNLLAIAARRSSGGVPP